MTKRLTRRQLVHKMQSFSGRHQELEVFAENLKRPVDDPRRRSIWMLKGIGGIGKSTLLRRFQSIAESQKHVTANVDEHTKPSVLDVMGAFASQIEAQAHHFEPFMSRYRTYQQLQNQIEADPERPSGFAAALGRAGGRILTETIKAVPGGALVPSLLGDDFIAEKSSELAIFLTKKVGNKDDVRLMLEPIDELTPLFIQSLTRITEDCRVALFFDTYERTSMYLDKWLREVLEGDTFSELPLEVLVVIAGRDDLGQEWTHEYIVPFVERIDLEPFTELESVEFLASHNITEAAITNVILKLSGGIPLLLTMLVNNLPKDINQMGDPSGEAIERFLKWVDDEAQRQAVITCAMPRFFNLDIVTLLSETEQGEPSFQFIKALSFVRQLGGKGWIYHDSVREAMLRYQREMSRLRWQEKHTQLAKHYGTLRDTVSSEVSMGVLDEHWRQYDLEWLYHTICAEGRRAEAQWVSRILDTFTANSPASYDQLLAETIRDAGSAIDDNHVVACGERCIVGLLAIDAEQNSLANDLLDYLVEVTSSFLSHRVVVALWLRGRNYYEQEAFEQAAADFSRLIELYPKDADSFFWRARSYQNLDKTEQAMKDFDRAIELQPDEGDSFFWRGLGYHKQEKHEAAVADFSRAIELQPEDSTNFFWRGVNFHAQRAYELAISDFNTAIDLQPDDGNYYRWRGISYRVQGAHEQAMADFNRAIELHPEDGNNYYWRGRCYHIQGSQEQAIADYSRAIKLQPEDTHNCRWRARSFYEQGAYEQAMADFNRAIELQPEEGDSFFGRGLSYYAQGAYEQAVADFSRAIELQPEDAYNYHWRARSYQALGENTRATADDNRSIELSAKKSES